MNIIHILLLSFTLTGCFYSVSKTETIVYTVSDRCLQYGEKAKASAFEKWFHRPTIKDKDEGWRLIGLTSEEVLVGLGFDTEEIKEYAKAIYFNDFMNDKEKDALSFLYYMRSVCDLREKGKSPPQIDVIKPGVKACWHKDKKLVESCIYSVVYPKSNHL